MHFRPTASSPNLACLVREEREEAGMLPEQAPGVFSQGAWVRVKGLTARPELNGERGRIVAYHAERSRYAVAMHLFDERILLKPSSLETAMDAECEAMIAVATDQYLASPAGQREETGAPDGVVAFDEACGQAVAALEAMDPSSAAAAARRAIALRPSSCAGHLFLADSANYGGDLRAAVVGNQPVSERRLRGAAAHYPGLLGLAPPAHDCATHLGRAVQSRRAQLEAAVRP